LLALGGVTLLLIGGIAGWRGRKRFPALLTGGLWFGALIFPVLGWFQVGAQTVADRYAYLPSLGLFLGVVWLGNTACQHWRGPTVSRATMLGLLLAALALRARQQIGCWKNSETLLAHAGAVTPDNWLAHYNLASYYEQQGRAPEALEQYQAAARIKPNYADAHNNAGVLLAKHRRYEEAIASFVAALAARPDFAEVKGNIAQTYLNQAKDFASAGKVAEAKTAAEQALQAMPSNSEAHIVLGTLQARAGDLPSAITHFEAALRLKPDNAMTHFNLGKALANSGHIDAAREHFQEALRLKPGATPILQALESLPSQATPAKQ
jgi:protein O-mannosyl-transferase